MKDYYQILGIDRSADEDAVKRAYRRLASQHHPDKGGDTTRFQEIQEAYATLSDAERRRQYDNPTQFNSTAGGANGFDFDTIFNMFGTRFTDVRPRSSAARIQLWIGLHDVAQGGPRTIAVSSPAGQQNIEINIPAGIEDGSSVRYARVAPGGLDLVVSFRVRAEPGWERQDEHVIRDVVISVWDLVLGGDVVVQTLEHRSISVTIPPGTQPGTMLRVRGHGLPRRSGPDRGDLFVRAIARLPESVSPELLEHIRKERGH